MGAPCYEVYVTTYVVPSSTDSRLYTATVDAPAGKVITGAGYSNEPAGMWPSSDGTQWNFEHVTIEEEVTLTAYLVCI